MLLLTYPTRKLTVNKESFASRAESWFWGSRLTRTRDIAVVMPCADHELTTLLIHRRYSKVGEAESVKLMIGSGITKHDKAVAKRKPRRTT